jgi:hypothetical protein
MVVKDVTRDPALCSRRLGDGGKIRGFDAQPIRYKDEVLGVLGLFTRIPIPDQVLRGCVFLPITSRWPS